jgi:hypothetical protein
MGYYDNQSPIGYGDSYYGQDQPVAAGGIALGDRDAALRRLEKRSPQFTSTLLSVLGFPSSLLMDVVSGQPLGSGSTGESALKSLGLLPDKKALGGWGRPVAGAALEMATDPLNLITLGTGAVSRAGRAAQAANIYTDAQRVVSRQMLNSGVPIRKYGDNALSAFQKNFGKTRVDLTDDDLWSRPLVGPREARRDLSLEDLVQARPSADQAKAIKDIDDYMSRFGQSYQDVAQQKLGGDIGFRLPFSDASAAFKMPDFLLGGASARGLDRLGQVARWSAPGRYLTSTFSNSVMGTVDEGDQILAKQLKRADDAADVVARQKTAQMLQELPEEAYTPTTGRALRNVIEGTADATEQNLVSGNAGLQAFVRKWGVEAKDYISRSRTAGIGSSELADKYGTKYFPRSLDKTSFDKEGAFRQGVNKGGKQYSVMTGDQLQRGYQTPGGTKTMQELSQDTMVAGPNRTLRTDREAAEYILRDMRSREAALAAAGRLPADQRKLARLQAQETALRNQIVTATGRQQANLQRQLTAIQARIANPPLVQFGRPQALKMARMLNQLTPEAIKKQHPIFGAHVAEDASRYFTGRERAISRANLLYDILGSTAKRANFRDIEGGGHTALGQAFRQLKLRSTNITDAAGNVIGVEGAKQQILDRLSRRAGFSGVDLDELKNISIDKKMMERLNRIADFYEQPEVHSKFLQAIDNITSMWKGSILAWPARFSRDWMSGLFSNMVEVRSARDLWNGYSGARYLIQGQFDKLDSIIDMMPRYRGMAAQARRQAFMRELAGAGILGGRQITDVGQDTAELAAGTIIRDSVLPGVSPRTTFGYQAYDAATLSKPLPFSRTASAELFNVGNWKKQPGRTADLYGRNIAKADQELTNPILRWSSKLGDTTDSINRSSGYISLLLQGISPEEAARRIKLSQVDYSSLTAVERGYLRRVIPFWAYTSRISSYIGQTLANDPGGALTQFGIRLPERLAQNDSDRGYVPSSVRQRYGFSLEPLRQMPGLGGFINAVSPKKEGVTGWLTDIDLPGIDQLNTIKLATDIDGTRFKLFDSLWKTSQSFMGSGLHPALKTSAEAMTGYDFYTGRLKRESESTLQAIGRRTGMFNQYSAGDQWAGYLDPVAQLVPFAPRVLQLARRGVDSQRIESRSARGAQMAFNALTGVKIQNVSDDVRRQDAMQKINEIIGDEPNIREFEQTYIPKEAIPYVDPQTLQLYALQRQLGREKRQERERAKKGGSGYYY